MRWRRALYIMAARPSAHWATMRLFWVVALFVACARADLFATITNGGTLTSSCTIALPAGTGTLKVVHCPNLVGNTVSGLIDFGILPPPSSGQPLPPASLPSGYVATPASIAIGAEVSVDPPTFAACSLKEFAMSGATAPGGNVAVSVRESGVITVSKLGPVGYSNAIIVQCIESAAATTTTAKVPTPPPTTAPVRTLRDLDPEPFSRIHRVAPRRRHRRRQQKHRRLQRRPRPQRPKRPPPRKRRPRQLRAAIRFSL